jgi:hypothetical protein
MASPTLLQSNLTLSPQLSSFPDLNNHDFSSQRPEVLLMATQCSIKGITCTFETGKCNLLLRFGHR